MYKRYFFDLRISNFFSSAGFDCSSGLFFCNDRCLDANKQCDYKHDCSDRSDETKSGCSTYKKSLKRYDWERRSCRRYLFYILEYSVRNNYPDRHCHLTYNSMGHMNTKPHYPFFELTNCELAICHIGEYKCRQSGYCISIAKVCDMNIHCPYGDDENFCGNSTIKKKLLNPKSPSH